VILDPLRRLLIVSRWLWDASEAVFEAVAVTDPSSAWWEWRSIIVTVISTRFAGSGR
jgi:hypothetical protein